MQYSSKLLLFGEHTINRGSDALAIPYSDFGGNWAYSVDFSKQESLPALADYLQLLQKDGILQAKIDLTDFYNELKKGLFFDSNIPVGYGLGSSGALCAAIYDRFSIQKIERTDSTRFIELKSALAQIESFFHGSSSGIDPLICYLQQPMLIRANGQMETVALPETSDLSFFLLDTGIRRTTEPLVKYFLNRCEDKAFLADVTTHLVWHNKHAIAALLNADWNLLFENVSEISRFQIEQLPDMTPAVFHDVWKAGLQGNLYRLKMCGAGGGGFILGMTHHWKQTQMKLRDYKITPVIIGER